MTDWGQFGYEEDKRAERPPACQVCEAMLPDAVDGLLSEAEQRAFDRHVAGCVVCAREMEEAQRGAAWLGMLKQQTPEPSPALLERILAQTSGAQATGWQEAGTAVVIGVPVAGAPALKMPAWADTAIPKPRAQAKAKVVSAWQSVRETLSLEWMRPLLQPRMAMTAAMAFFSIALTLNLTGVRLSEMSTASLRPSSLRRTVAERSASAVRSFQNMRVVYQAEAQVNDLRSSWQEQENAPALRRRREENETSQPKAPVQRKQAAPQGSSELDFAPVAPQGAGMSRKGA